MTPPAATEPVLDPFSRVVGQARVVEELRASVARPVHAYLLVGPQGSGKRSLATAFAAALLAEGLDGEARDRTVALALAGTHPDLHLIQRVGASISAEQAREVRDLAAHTPVEGDRKVLVLDEFHLVQDSVGPMLLKTIEEPPDGTFFLVLVEDVPPELVTVASRCVRIELGALTDQEVRLALEAQGVPPATATEAADAAAGDLRRARVLATDPDLAARRDAWYEVPVRLDDTGHTVTVLIDELLERIEAAAEPLKERHAEELAELAARVEQYGERGSGRKLLEDRHKRELRRHRTDELRFGLVVLARRYRDALAATERPGPYLEALAAIQRAAEGLVRNPNERLQLQALLLGLPALPR